jgi:NADPH-dependent 2,4-dienoyl-CoA reductase/sulfur reductase-like enzyme
MKKRQFLIIGGGLAAQAAVQGIRETGEEGSILVVSDEVDPPYSRPPLSKGLWRKQAIDSIWLPVDAGAAELHLHTRIVALDPSRKSATSAAGEVFPYDKLLLATGGSPRRLNDSDPSVTYFRRLADFRHIRELARRDAEFAVIGGGFIGSEIAASLAMNDCRVSLFFSGLCIGDRLFPRPLANFLNLYFRKQGVDVRFGEPVQCVERHGDKLVVRAEADGGDLSVDAVIAGIGIDPNVALAKAAGLDVRGGIVVDARLRTSDPDIFAAGDVANFPCAALQQRMRIEHEDNAAAMGRIAGLNMTGRSEPYSHLPYFYSDLFDLGYEAVGELDSRLEIVEDWETKFRKGVIYYLRNNRVRGVLLWNTFGLVDAARALIGSQQRVPVHDLVAQVR